MGKGPEQKNKTKQNKTKLFCEINVINNEMVVYLFVWYMDIIIIIIIILSQIFVK